jgi:hypothetical protein
MSTAEENAMWIIDEIVDEASRTGFALSDDEVQLLSTPVWELTEDRKPMLLALNNRLVPLIRTRIERFKANGSPTVKSRAGLVLPVAWHYTYISVHNSELPWIVSGIMQNVMLNNSLAGERRPWKSK